MKYISTRNKSHEVSAAQAIVQGIAPDGGLYVPVEFPQLDSSTIEELCSMEYSQRAARVLSWFLDDFSEEELLSYTEKAYSRFTDESVCPVMELDEGLYIMELYHGPTLAFKDVALTLLPYLMTASRKKLGIQNKSLILVATSGDTGKAALEGFRDVDGTAIMVFYPSDGVSDMQKLQMMTQQGTNVAVCGIRGNFDDAQTAVKRIFRDEAIRGELADLGYELTSANSINWGRLLPQIVYYISAYCDLVGSELIEYGDPVNYAVPTGNFGNILAGYYAYRMGLPVGKLVCASNQNKVLTDFFANGVYDTDREFFRSMSPSMDILVSSNLERLLFELCGRDDEYIRSIYAQLADEGHFTVTRDMLAAARGLFVGNFATEADTQETMCNIFEEYDYVMDPHTAVAVYVHNNYVLTTDDNTDTVILSTASPFKFPTDVYEAVAHTTVKDAFKAAQKLHSISAMDIPTQISELREAEKRFTDYCDTQDMPAQIISAIHRMENDINE